MEKNNKKKTKNVVFDTEHTEPKVGSNSGKKTRKRKSSATELKVVKGKKVSGKKVDVLSVEYNIKDLFHGLVVKPLFANGVENRDAIENKYGVNSPYAKLFDITTNDKYNKHRFLLSTDPRRCIGHYIPKFYTPINSHGYYNDQFLKIPINKDKNVSNPNYTEGFEDVSSISKNNKSILPIKVMFIPASVFEKENIDVSKFLLDKDFTIVGGGNLIYHNDVSPAFFTDYNFSKTFTFSKNCSIDSRQFRKVLLKEFDTLFLHRSPGILTKSLVYIAGRLLSTRNTTEKDIVDRLGIRMLNIITQELYAENRLQFQYAETDTKLDSYNITNKVESESVTGTSFKVEVYDILNPEFSLMHFKVDIVLTNRFSLKHSYKVNIGIFADSLVASLRMNRGKINYLENGKKARLKMQNCIFGKEGKDAEVIVKNTQDGDEYGYFNTTSIFKDEIEKSILDFFFS